MSEHSKLPWRWDGDEISPTIFCSTGNVFGGAVCEVDPIENRVANAAFIVRAVNSYDRLLGALEDQLAAVRRIMSCTSLMGEIDGLSPFGFARRLEVDLQDAIAAAEADANGGSK